MQKQTLPVAIMLLCIASTLIIGSTAAQTDPTPIAEDPVFFVVGDGATYSGGVGWYAGYVISGEPGETGTYTLQISANGPQSRFPVDNTKVIVCISREALSTAKVIVGSNTSNPLTITKYTAGNVTYYGANGGVFAESDYYGYNDTYTIPSLTYAQTHWPTNEYPLQVKVTFNANATSASKVMFLCYGIDSKGDPAKTPFSGGTLIVAAPEYVYAPVAVIACIAAYGVYRKRNLNS